MTLTRIRIMMKLILMTRVRRRRALKERLDAFEGSRERGGVVD